MTTVVEIKPTDPRILRPLYSLRQAAAYLGVRPSTLHHWAEGSNPLITTLPTARHNPSIPFVGLAEAFVLAKCRQRGMTPRNIREGVAGIKRTAKLDHALAHKMIYTNQGDLALHLPSGMERSRDGQLILETAQKYADLIRFGEDEYADELTLDRFKKTAVVVNPLVADGEATVKNSWVSIDDVVARLRAGETLEVMQEDFQLNPEQVHELARAFNVRTTSS